MLETYKQKTIDYYTKNEKSLEIGFFVAGFIWDIVMMSEIDDLFSLGQQALYLIIIASILHHEILFRLHKWRPQGNFIIKFWNYRNLLLHFILGSLLSVYSLFYIKSSSFLSSLGFLLVMIALLVGNELPILKKAKVSFKMGLYGICLFSFISILYPLGLGFVGWLPFGLSMATTLLIFFFQVRLLRNRLPDDKTLFQAVAFPGISVVFLFAGFYSLGWIPPVPISATMQGVYHHIEKRDGKYWLSKENNWWKFWHSSDQDFKAREGDKIYYYVQIYSPGRFADQVYVRWLFKDPVQGWQKTDRIPLQITGGRKEGFRAMTTKANYQPGDWRVQVETNMGHEITRLNFTVSKDESQEPRFFDVVVK